jgi:hypothetical protein
MEDQMSGVDLSSDRTTAARHDRVGGPRRRV